MLERIIIQIPDDLVSDKNPIAYSFNKNVQHYKVYYNSKLNAII